MMPVCPVCLVWGAVPPKGRRETMSTPHPDLQKQLESIDPTLATQLAEAGFDRSSRLLPHSPTVTPPCVAVLATP